MAADKKPKLVMLGVKVDPRMVRALESVSEDEFISKSVAVKQAIDMYLKSKGINWRE